MKIAFVVTNFPDYSLEFAAELGLSHEVLLLVDERRLQKDAGDKLIAKAAKHTRLVQYRQHTGPLWPKTTAQILARLVAFRPDVILGHEDWRPYTGPTLRLGAKIAPLVLIVHDPLPHIGRDGDNMRRNAQHVARLRQGASHILVHGERCRTALAALLGDPHRITSIPHGPILVPHRVTPPPRANRFLMFGRMEAYKGLNILLAACKRLDVEAFAYSLTIAGAGPDLTTLEAEFRTLKSCTVLNKFIPREEAFQLFQECNFALAPYTGASQSGVVAAAFANGRPVIASDVGGLLDAVCDGRNGLIVPAENAQALGDAIKWACTEPAAQSLWQGAVRSSQQELSWGAAAQRFAQVATELTRR